MKTGVVFEGGASRAYFSVGAMDALLDEKIYADYCIGVSAGIANGVSYASRQRGRNLEVGLKYLSDKRYMGLKYFLKPKNRSFYNMDFVFGEVPEKCVPFDMEAYSKYCKETYAGLTDMETGKEVYLPALAEDKSWKNIIATCALPFLFPPIKIGGKPYMDGGIADPVPFEKAFSDGCDRVVIVLTRELGYEKKSDALLRLAVRKYRKRYPAFSKALENRAEVYNREYREIARLGKEGKLFVIAPKNTLNWRRTEKSPEAIKKMYDEGYSAVKENKEALKTYLNGNL